MKISLAQTNITWENKDVNIERASEIADVCKASDLLLFPEMSFTGFSMNTDITAEDGIHTTECMKVLAMKYHFSIGFGWVRINSNDIEKCENVYTIIGPKGEKISEYVKIHPFSFSGEDEKFHGGNNTSKYYIDNIPCSTFICYDLRFPEVFRSVADFAHVFIIPACWPAKRSEQWKTLLRARAIENQAYIVGVNCQGNIGGQYYSGDSCVINPNGDVTDMISNKEGIITFDFIDDVEEYRVKFPVLDDRRIGLYRELG